MSDGAEARLPAVRVAGVVLAAGTASRMGGSKVTLPVDGRAMVARVVDAALGSRLVETVVVVGNDADEVGELLRDRPVRTARNAEFARGMSTSMQVGLRAVGHECDGVLFLLADQPFVTTALIDLLIGAFAGSEQAIVRPEVLGRPANPVLMPARLFAELLEESGDRGGRRVLERHADEVRTVRVHDPLLVTDVDSPDDYERARQR